MIMEFTEFELSVFLDEVAEKLDDLSENILILEQEKNNEDAVKEMFRAAHTIKGSSGIMGFEKMTRLTHEMENILDQIRNKALTVNTEIFNLLFECIDALKILQEEIVSKEDSFSIDPLLGKIQSVFYGKDKTEESKDNANENKFLDFFDDVERSVIKEAKLKGCQPLWITINLDPECQMKGVRAYLVFHNLQDYGEIIKSEPCIEEVQDGNFDTKFSVLLLCHQEPDQVKNTLEIISEVVNVEILEVETEEEPTNQSSCEIDNSLPIETGQAGNVPKESSFEMKSPATKNNELDKDIKGGLAPTGQSILSSKVATNINGQEKKLTQTVRVNVDKLDKLMNLVGELVIDRGRLSQVGTQLSNKIGSDEILENLGEITSHLAQVANELQDEIMKARMLPVDQVFNRFPRMVRDISQKLGKEINFNVTGGDTELDRTVIEAIGDPLVHLIRNAVDHGIENPEQRKVAGKSSKGTINLSARHQENYVLITVEDDGKGINPEGLKKKAIERGLLTQEEARVMSYQDALEIIFYPGFSTAETVNDVSGRGVGMDIVRTQIQSINGTIEIDSQVGYGSTFYIKLPLTLAIIQALLAKVEEQIYSFPLANVIEILKISHKNIKLVYEQEVIVLRGEILPLYSLAEVYELEHINNFRNQDDIFIVVLGIGEKKLGIVVDQLLGEQEVVIKTLGSFLGEVVGVSGATILGDGKVALIVDVRGLISNLKKEGKKLEAV